METYPDGAALSIIGVAQKFLSWGTLAHVARVLSEGIDNVESVVPNETSERFRSLVAKTARFSINVSHNNHWTIQLSVRGNEIHCSLLQQ